METAALILSVDDGPKKGETFCRRPGSFIRIGRVVRGNTVTIKDPGISQKHLIVDFHSEIFRWTVTDLGTSNGTSVNGAVIAPNAAFPLADGDIIKIGENTLMSVKISVPSSAPEPRTRRGRRLATAASFPIEIEDKEEKVTKLAKHMEMGSSQGKLCPESVNVDDAVKLMPEERKRRMPTRASSKPCSTVVVEKANFKEKSTKNYQMGRGQRKKGVIFSGASRNDKILEPVVEEDCRSSNRAIERSARGLKEKNEEREVGNEKMERPTKNGGKEMGCLGDTSEKVEGLVNDGRGRKGRSKKGSVHSRVSWKDDVLKSVLVKGRVTRASTRAISSSAVVSKVHDGEDEGIKEEKAEEPAANRGKQGAKGKRGGCSSRISSEGVARCARIPKDLQKGKMVAALDLNSVYLTRQEKKKAIGKNNSSGDRKKLSVSREVRFRIEEVDNYKEISMSEQSSKTEDVHFPGKTKLAYSWSSFSKIRGIPNTTNKYREDRMINCHATPFETRVERALNRGIGETSSSMET